ncbi:MAG: helix-turn-helix domain-containing protein [Candidatus Woesearchaeota archaeon]|jgi:sugar-specific transcriptional regulator TrmB
MNLELLESLGLTKAEIKVYLALLELGRSTTGPIVEKSRASSSKIYELLEKLMQKGLVSFVIENGIKYFEAADPRRLMDYMNDKEELLIKQKQELNQLIPELELKQKLSKDRSGATIFRGLKGVKTAYEDILKTLHSGEEYYVSGGMLQHKAYFDYIAEFHKRRAKLGIKVRLLYTDLAKSIAKNIKDLPGTKIKFAPQHFFSACFIVMYKTKTLITVASKEELTLFQIDNKEITDSFISQFKLLWDKS